MLKKPLLKNVVYHLSDLDSEFECNNQADDATDTQSIISSQVSELSSLDVTNNLRYTIDLSNSNLNELESEEERKRYFMSIAFKMKFKYTDRIKNKKIKITDIYNLAKEENIKKEDWYIFIYTQLGISDNSI